MALSSRSPLRGVFMVTSLLLAGVGGCGATGSRGESLYDCNASAASCPGAGAGGETGSGDPGQPDASSTVGQDAGSEGEGDGTTSPPNPSDRPNQDTADVPGDDSSVTAGHDDGSDYCGAAYTQCLEDGGNLLDCLPLYEDCGGGDDDAGNVDQPDCCEEINGTCGGTESASTCGGLQELCANADCSALDELCPPSGIPMSEACELAYRACYPGFAVNNCLRIPLDGCVLLTGDLDFCEIRNVACEARIEYCENLVGFGSAYIGCAERGDVFDACWENLGCAVQAPTCTDDGLLQCSSQAPPLCAPSF